MDESIMQAMGIGPLSSVPILAQWTIRAIRNDEIVYEEDKTNIIVDGGRADVLYLLFGLSSGVSIVSLAAGACSTAATHADTNLNYELLGNATRIALTNISLASLTSSDVVSDTFTDGLGNTYYKKIVVQGIYPTSDSNNGQPFQEYGLMSTLTKPSTPTAISGLMFNHLVAGAPIIKDGATQIVVIITLRV